MDTALQHTIPPFPDPPAAHLQSSIPSHPQPSGAPVVSDIDAVLAESMLADTPAIPSKPPAAPVGSFQKEAAPIPSQPQPEIAPVVEVQEREKLPTEVEGWLQHLDEAGDITLKEPVTHDGEVLLADTEAQVVKEKLVLPMTQTGVQKGLKMSVSDSARWLAEWCVHLIKMMKDGVKYAPEESKSR